MHTPFLTGQMFPATTEDLPGGLDRLFSTGIHQEGGCQINSPTEVFSISLQAGFLRLISTNCWEGGYLLGALSMAAKGSPWQQQLQRHKESLSCIPEG